MEDTRLEVVIEGGHNAGDGQRWGHNAREGQKQETKCWRWAEMGDTMLEFSEMGGHNS